MPAHIVVLAGVNGAGKSSVAGTAILKRGGQFYNPDTMARKIMEMLPSSSNDEANSQAWEMGFRGLERALNNEEHFAFETTLGGNSITNMLLTGSKNQAEIHMSYVGLNSIKLHIERVKKRVAAGGHDIPDEKIQQRYRSSRENLILLMPHLSSLRVYDNSVNADTTPKPLKLLQMKNAKIISHSSLNDIPVWAKPILATAFKIA